MSGRDRSRRRHPSAQFDFGFDGTGQLIRYHPAYFCEGHPCPFHHPSDHAMRQWPLHVREDTDFVERICPHGIGHPDPDSVRFFTLRSGETPSTDHGCDGCCS